MDHDARAEELREEIARTRVRLGERLEALSDAARPVQLARRASTTAKAQLAERGRLLFSDLQRVALRVPRMAERLPGIRSKLASATPDGGTIIGTGARSTSGTGRLVLAVVGVTSAIVFVVRRLRFG